MSSIEDIFDKDVLVKLYKRLEAFGLLKYGDEIYATESYQDCLQKVLFRAWRRPAPKEPVNDFFSYFCRAIDNCIRDALRRAKKTDYLLAKDPEKVSDSESIATRPGNPGGELEWAVEVALMESWFAGDTEMQTYLHLLTLGYKRSEIAKEMELDPRKVTDFHRRLKRRLARHRSEEAIHIRKSGH